MQDVATLAGVSKSSVSLALRHHPNIPEKTRNRILCAAHELGYRTNPLVAANMANMRSANTKRHIATLAYLSSHSKDFVLSSNSPLLLLYKGARDRCAQLGYDLEFVELAKYQNPKKSLSRILKYRGIHGLLFAPLEDLDTTITIDWRQFASVALGYTLNQPPLHRACPDIYSITRKLIYLLLDRGYRKIGFAYDEAADRRGFGLARAAYLLVQDSLREEDRLKSMFKTSQEKPSLHEWLDAERPQVVVTSFPHDFISQAESLGLRIPEDLGVATYFWMPNVEFSDRISGYHQNYRMEGCFAVDLLIGQLHRNEHGIPDEPKSLQVMGSWNEGSSIMKQVPL